MVVTYRQNAALFSLWLQQPSKKQKRYEFSQKTIDYTVLGFKLWEKTSLPKNPHLCSEHFDADYFEYTARLQNDLLGLCPWKLRLFPRSFPANQPDLRF